MLSSSGQGGKQNRCSPIYDGVNLAWLFPGEQLHLIYIHVQRIRIFLLLRRNLVSQTERTVVVFENNKPLFTATLSSVFSKKKKMDTCWILMRYIFSWKFWFVPHCHTFLHFLSLQGGKFLSLRLLEISGCSICSLNRASELFLHDLC